ncbi:MAG: tetratricopeptide repeat protein [Cyanobacteria bacterium]|nr:tetratricopeptide repeat protein [Cyanobacteriota bacterium]
MNAFNQPSSPLPQEQVLAIPNVLNQALEAHHLGHYDKAQIFYQQALEESPHHPWVLSQYGIFCAEMGQDPLAISLLEKAVSLSPKDAQVFQSLGIMYVMQGNFQEGLKAFQTAGELSPLSEDAWINAGQCLYELHHYPEALTYFQKAIHLAPNKPETLLNLGNTLKQLEQYTEAEFYYVKGQSLAPSDHRFPYNLALLNSQGKHFPQALTYCQKALSIAPQFGEGYETLGNIQYQLGNFEAARQSYETAISFTPEDADLYYNLGTVFLSQSLWDQAQQAFTTALQNNPKHLNSLYGLGNVLSQFNQMEEALSLYTQALKIAEALEAENTLAVKSGCESQLKTVYNIESAVSARLKRTLFFPFIFQSNEEIDEWRHRIQEGLNELSHPGKEPSLCGPKTPLKNPAHSIGRTPFYLPYQGRNDLKLQLSYANTLKPYVPTRNLIESPHNSKPRIGFISKYFRSQHTMGKVFSGLIQTLNRDEFSIYVFMLDDGLGEKDAFPLHPDDCCITLPLWETEAACELVLKEKLDILFYTDIGMEPSTYFMAFSRLAPVQMVSWGHPETTGLDTIDYYLSAEVFETPEAQTHYSEKLLRMKHLPTRYQPPTPIPVSKEDIGFVSKGSHYLCPQSLYKIHPDFDPLMQGILQEDPTGTLYFYKGFHPSWEENLWKRWQKTLPFSYHSRIQFLPRTSAGQFYQALSLCDVMLDPMHFGGGNTSLEALSFGTPIVTYPQAFMRGRFTQGFYQMMNHPEIYSNLVAQTPEDYIQTAVKLATEKEYRHHLQEKILEHGAILYNQASSTLELESIFRQILQRV